jgi:hypothetical protein
MIDINPHALILLKEWYWWTREANCKSNYPPITHMWEKRGLAWVEVGVGFDLSRGTKPRDVTRWEEAGHQFCRLDKMTQDIIIGLMFEDIGITKLSYKYRISRLRVKAIIHSGLKEYDGYCLDVGLVEPMDHNRRYLSGAKEIGTYLGGVSTKTVQRWINERNLPVKRVSTGSILADTHDLDTWFRQQIAKV